ncbi:hypothetical protein QBZ16_004520 [Prototheca wickerhamii]|uniref:Protein phosphatase 1 regulatory subunit 11 n=1 Tax=Prototheca wickerhamii TaxID=3111 RepID=A0AAD9IFW3_PROWI|nr:hypothetical protein QBZ16_004520 [Prototheca wickerhamii]
MVMAEAPAGGEATRVIIEEEEPTSSSSAAETTVQEHLVLKLAPRRQKKSSKGVKWAEDVVDNELLGKRKSKKCCQFHKQRQFGDWSDSDSECDCPDEAEGLDD